MVLSDFQPLLPDIVFYRHVLAACEAAAQDLPDILLLIRDPFCRMEWITPYHCCREASSDTLLRTPQVQALYVFIRFQHRLHATFCIIRGE